MKEQQIIAIENPCEFADQCANDRYLRVIQKGRYVFSVILTVNVGEE